MRTTMLGLQAFLQALRSESDRLFFALVKFRLITFYCHVQVYLCQFALVSLNTGAV